MGPTLPVALILLTLTSQVVGRTAHTADAFQRYAPTTKSLTKGNNFNTILKKLDGAPRKSGGGVAQLPTCYAHDVSARQLSGHWRLDEPSGQYFFEPRACRLQRLKHAQLLSCLAGKRISIVGDSVSRQHYTTFVTWIATGYLPQPYDDGIFSPTNAYKWRTWEAYFAGLQKRVLQGPAKLARQHKAQSPAPVIQFTMQNPAYDKDVKSKRMALAMHGIGPRNESLYIDYVFAAIKPSWVKAGTSALDVVFAPEGAAPIPPDIVVLNMGAWWTQLANKNSDTDLAYKMGKIFKYGSQITNALGTKTTLLWRTSMIAGWAERNVLVTKQAVAMGWDVLDASGLAEAMHRQRLWLNMRRTDGRVDKYHFLPVVYEQLIDILLTRLCT